MKTDVLVFCSGLHSGQTLSVPQGEKETADSANHANSNLQ